MLLINRCWLLLTFRLLITFGLIRSSSSNFLLILNFHRPISGGNGICYVSLMFPKPLIFPILFVFEFKARYLEAKQKQLYSSKNVPLNLWKFKAIFLEVQTMIFVGVLVPLAKFSVIKSIWAVFKSKKKTKTSTSLDVLQF